jgi:hypothetical protein
LLEAGTYRLGAAVSANSFESSGYLVLDKFLPSSRCSELLAAIDAYRAQTDLPEIFRATRGRPLRYSVIDGESIQRQLPEVFAFYKHVNQFVNAVTGKRLVPLNDGQVACNINITPSGGSYRWHYDRNAVTAIVYLNEVAGGETDCYPNYRISLGRRLGRSKLQQGLDWLLQAHPVRRAFGKSVVVEPATGRLLLMRGDRCLHSVRTVAAGCERVNVIMSYDAPNSDFAQANRLNSYLYDQEAHLAGDPNYASSRP